MPLPEIRSFRFPEAGSITMCACHDKEALIQIGDDVFRGEFDGSILWVLRRAANGSYFRRGISVERSLLKTFTESVTL